MEHHNIRNTLRDDDRVTSTYAEIYYNNNFCLLPISSKKIEPQDNSILSDSGDGSKVEWVSPSDLLIGKVELKAPFTSKITRGKTHEGILTIGNAVLEKERAEFLSSLKTLLEDNDAAWENILIDEKQKVDKKVKAVFLNIFKNKSDIMKKEVSNFYENSLQELENHLRSEICTVLQSARANIISHLNNEIQNNLRKERKILVNFLAKTYIKEVQKIKKYYKLLIDNELYKNNTLLNKCIYERNVAIKAFLKQIDSERLTGTMYIMSLERKKCKLKEMILENLQCTEIKEKLAKLKQKKDEFDGIQHKVIQISDINKQWEDKIKKILQIFLKFISFSLKILPEQSTFLLDFEKMVILQLNEIQKHPNLKNTVLFEEVEETNLFAFPSREQEESACDKEPLVVVGDISEPRPPQYGSRETLPCDEDLPYFRYDRKYFYAKCHGYEDIKKCLHSQMNHSDSNNESDAGEPSALEQLNDPNLNDNENRSDSLESLFFYDFLRLQECPDRKCNDWIKRNTFPYLASYLDYNEENYKRVIAILGQSHEKKAPPELICVKDIENYELPFAETNELHRTVGTQYSSQEDLTSAVHIECSCMARILPKYSQSHNLLKVTSNEALHEIMRKRKSSLQKLFDQNPSLLKLFTDEKFDYKL